MINFSQMLSEQLNLTTTENGAVTNSTSGERIVDLFGSIGSFTKDTSPQIKVSMFNEAYKENKELAVKVLFYALDIRAGLGQKETFLDILLDLCKTKEEIVIKNLWAIFEFGRWDMITKLAFVTQELAPNVSISCLNLIKDVLKSDISSYTPSLLGKWMPSENTSSESTRALAKWIRVSLGYTPKDYRKMLSALRAKVGIIETKLSQGFTSIDYEKVPSRAMLKYTNAFYHRDEKGFKDYLDKVEKGEAKINSGVLYPMDLVKILDDMDYETLEERDTKEKSVNMQWNSLPNYMLNGDFNCIPVVDVSGSMQGTPLYAAVGIGLYISEKLTTCFKNKFITFSESPALLSINESLTFSEKIEEMTSSDWGYNTDIKKVFDLILDTAVSQELDQSDIPTDILIMSDMEFDCADKSMSKVSLFKNIKKKWLEKGYVLPRLVFWNLDASGHNFPMTSSENCLFVSGYSPIIMQSIMNKKVVTPLDIIKEAVLVPRYDDIVFI
ncbi:MAG: DUF2828 family protein [Fusobacteriaceae bacterium]